MVTEDEIHQVFELLSTAYPAYRPTNPDALLELYLRHLESRSLAALLYAAHTHIQQSNYFPSIAEVIKLAEGYVPPQPQGPDLRARAVQLEDAAFEGDLDPAEWEALAVEFEAAGRVSGAYDIRRKAQVYAALLA